MCSSTFVITWALHANLIKRQYLLKSVYRISRSLSSCPANQAHVIAIGAIADRVVFDRLERTVRYRWGADGNGVAGIPRQPGKPDHYHMMTGMSLADDAQDTNLKIHTLIRQLQDPKPRFRASAAEA